MRSAVHLMPYADCFPPGEIFAITARRCLVAVRLLARGAGLGCVGLTVFFMVTVLLIGTKEFLAGTGSSVAPQQVVRRPVSSHLFRQRLPQPIMALAQQRTQELFRLARSLSYP